ncbi:hypothetical protein [Staphylococcus rostri]|uniref:Uncharacterized protein n=1 Tax=Staphylococcus rostri TaxID=522262 RepID=A0A2K3YJQ5_9STAP|nr:hypothetical protein [Staphylococcus rostri]PNZ25836.1 hypothetical protein CD122_09150 [Staphylococcus rostri]
MDLTKDQARFLEIMQSLGYQFNENKKSEGIEVHYSDGTRVVTIEDILNSSSDVQSDPPIDM